MVPLGVMAKLDGHARECLPCESVGMLVYRNNGRTFEFTDYLPLENQATRRDAFQVAAGRDAELVEGERGILVHSHPKGPAVVSRQDVERADESWFGYLYGVYAVSDSRLVLWVLDRERPRLAGIAGL